MHRIPTRLAAVVAVVAMAATGLLASSAGALSNPSIPILTVDHTVGSKPWPTGALTSVNANDVEGVAYVAADDSIWVADDNRDRIFELDSSTGALKSQITAATFQTAPAVGSGAIAAGTLPDSTRTDDFETLMYDQTADVLYLTSGNCCGSAPYNPTVFQLTRVSGHFQPTSWQPLPEGEDPTAGGWRPGTGLYVGKSNRIKTYDYASNTLGSDKTLPVNHIVGITFVGSNIAFVTTATPNTSSGRTTADSDSTIHRFDISGSTWTKNTAWTFPLKNTGMIDARDLAIIGDTFVVTDGYDYRSGSNHLVFWYQLGDLPPPTASFNAVPTTGNAPFTVQFTDTSTGNPTSWAWTFGDGGTSTARNPSHNYTVPGTYTAKLIATNAAGSTSATQSITVEKPTGLPGGYVLDGFGGIQRFKVGTGALPSNTHGGGYWKGWDIARGLTLRSSGKNGYMVDGWGGTHPFGVGPYGVPAQVKGGPYWKGWDIARGIAMLPNGRGGYIVDGFGGIHPFHTGTNPQPPRVYGGPYWKGQDRARGIAISPDGEGGFVVDRTGRLYPFKIGTGGKTPDPPNGVFISGGVPVQGVGIVSTGTGGFTVDGYGRLHRFGIGSFAPPPAASGGPYWPGWDIARDVAMLHH